MALEERIAAQVALKKAINDLREAAVAYSLLPVTEKTAIRRDLYPQLGGFAEILFKGGREDDKDSPIERFIEREFMLAEKKAGS